MTRPLDLLRELVALVRGECPSLLNEDSGGDSRLSLAIDAALAAPPPDPPGLELDNHHNALKCPHCNPKGLVLRDPAARQSDPLGLVALVREWQEAYSEFWEGQAGDQMRAAERLDDACDALMAALPATDPLTCAHGVYHRMEIARSVPPRTRRRCRRRSSRERTRAARHRIAGAGRSDPDAPA